MAAITPLNELYPEDINAVRQHVDTWLRGHTHNMVGIDDLAKILETLPVSGNVMAAVDVVYDISDLIDRYKTQGIDIFDWANLGIDLIGVIPAPATASVRVVARPALKLVREEFKKQVKKAGQEQLKNQAKQGAKQDTAQLLGDAILTVIGNHINEQVAGDIEKFCTSGLTQLNTVLTGCGQHIQTITDTTNQGVIRVVNTGQVYTNVNANRQAANRQAGGIAKGIESRDIGRVLTNAGLMAKNLGSALVKTQANATGYLASRVLSFTPETKQAILKIGDNIRVFGVTANKKVVGLGNPNEAQSIGWLFKKLLDSAVVYRKKKPPQQQTQVKQNQTATAQRNNNSGQLESTNLQAKAKTNANGCKNGTATSTGCSISFAKGTETLLHEDAQIHPLFNEQLLRSYSSDLYQYDHGMFGARWITPFTTAIVPRTEYDEGAPKQIGGFEYIGLDGRGIELQDIKHGESYFDATENFTYSHISDDLKAITFGQSHQIYKLDKASKTYRLVSITHEHDFTVGVRYDHIVDGKTYLSDVVFKQGEKELAHVGFQLNTQCKVAVAWLIENGQLERVLAQYGYDEYGNLVQAVNEFGQSHEYAYDHHLITRYTDLTGRGMNLAYDGILPSSKAVAEWADDNSAASQLEWDANIRKTTVRDLQGNETEHYYGYTGYTYRTVYPDGLQEWFFRDENKNVTTHIGLDGSETHYTYDKRGNVLTMTQPDGCTFHYSYDENDRLIGHVDAEHGKWLKEYDEKGNLIRELDPLKHATHYRYNDLGLPVSIQDAKGGIKQLQYDKQGNLVRYVDCSGKAMQWEYDERNRVTCVTNALREKVTYHYSEPSDEVREPIVPNLPLNAIGQLERISHPDGSEEHFIHDAEGRLLVHIDAKEQQTKYEYNQAGLITQRTDAMGQTLKYTWDILSRLTCLTNENGARYQFEYDAMGRLLSETDFDGKRTEYKYDSSNGQLTTSIEIAKRYGQKNDTLAPKDRIQQFVFDSMGRLEQRTAGYGHAGHDLEHAQSEEFAYDGRGQLIKAKNAHSEIQWVYDAIGNLTREHHHDFTTKKTAVWKHVYDEIHDRVRTVRPDGQTLNWMTYGSGHVYGLAVNGDDLVTFERDDLHRETLRHYANGLTMSQSYDVMGRLHQQNIINYHKNSYGSQVTTQTAQNNAVQDTKNLIERVYKYDRTGQLTNIKDSRRGNFSYHYDPVGRLIDATSKLGRETFEFDPASNLLDKNAFDDGYASTETKRQPHIVDNIVKQYLDSKYEYDAFGQLIQQNNSTTQSTLRLEWDVFGRMVKSRNGQHTAQYRYDALGRRIAKTTTRSGQSQSTVYGWDGDTLAYESTDQKTTHYVYEKDSFVPLLQINYDQAVNLHTTPQWSKDEPYNIYADPLFNSTQSAVDLTRIYYYHCDHLGTPQELSNSMAQVVWQGQYKVWGELVADKQRTTQQWAHENPSVQQLIENSEIITNNLRFQGQYFDFETGLHYNRYRYYSPEVGRFISKDPIGLLGGLNGYAYAPNPIGWVDPLGLNRNKNPNNWLQHHEEKVKGDGKGHTIDRHVGKSDCYLRARVDPNQKNVPKAPKASTYKNQTDAENAISKAFKQNRKEIKEWSKNAENGKKLAIDYQGTTTTGRGVTKKNLTVQDKTNATVVLKSDGKGKYVILTSYPK